MAGGPARPGGPPGVEGPPGTGEGPGAPVAERSLPEARLGQKVSILYRLTGDEEYRHSEVVGILQRLTVDPARGPLLTVVRRTGELVEVPRADIVRMKIVPTGGGPFRPPRSWKGS